MGSKKSSGSSTSVTNTKHKQDKQYGRLLGGADSWLSSGGYDKHYGGRDDFNPVATLNPNMTSGIAGIAGGGSQLSNIYGTMGQDTLKQNLGAWDPNATGVNKAIQGALEQSMWDFETNQMPDIRQGAIGSGQGGSTRHGIAEGIARSRLAQGGQNLAGNMLYNDQQQHLGRQQQTLQGLQGITTGLLSGDSERYRAGSLEQHQEQKELLGQLDKWAYENNISANDLAMYKQLISGDMGGVATSTGEGGGGGGGALGGFGSAIGSIGGSLLSSFLGSGGGA